MSTYRIDYSAHVATELGGFEKPRRIYERATEAFGTVKDAFARFHAIASDPRQGVPAEFQVPENHPDFLPFMRLQKNALGIGDTENLSFSAPGTVFLSRVN